MYIRQGLDIRNSNNGYYRIDYFSWTVVHVNDYDDWESDFSRYNAFQLETVAQRVLDIFTEEALAARASNVGQAFLQQEYCYIEGFNAACTRKGTPLLERAQTGNCFPSYADARRYIDNWHSVMKNVVMECCEDSEQVS
jgi:hypothetical protein